MESRSIAIDGPSGAGKSTIARICAREFGLIYVDTGAIYRCVGLFAIRSGVSSKDAEGVKALLDSINIELEYDEYGVQHVLLNGEDVSQEIRMPEVSIYASDVSAIPEVRAFLLNMQRKMAVDHDVIMDGRDIGTVVLPNAGLKIFLTATPEERAHRRFAELRGKNIETEFGDVLKDINYRDKNDSSRSTAPLKPAVDAVIVNTTGFELERSLRVIKALIREHLIK